MIPGVAARHALRMRSPHARIPSTITVFVVTALAAAAAQPRASALSQDQRTESASSPSSLVPVGSAIVDVTVVDRFGAPLEGASVKLRGVINRDAISDDVGMVVFHALPAGRYDVVASMKGLLSSLPRVVDVPEFGLRAVAVTLKPHGRMAAMTACGGFDPTSVLTLSRTAHLVLHVKVIDQDTIESKLPPDGSFAFISTLNRVQVLRSFKQNLHAPLAGSLVTIRQGGGRIDRGDYIDTDSLNRLAPLNVGDEYVLFVHVDPRGTYTIVGAEEGAFRIRNGRVDALGNAGAASTWNQQPVAKFFEALRR